MLSGVSLPSTPASAVPYSEAESRHGSVMTRRAADQSAPLLAEHLPGQHQLHVQGAQSRPGQAGVDHILDERRVAEQDHLVEGRPELPHHAEDLGPSLPGATTVIG